MTGGSLKETIAQRVERGRAQNSPEDGAIVPFPSDANFADPITMLPSYGREWVSECLNDGFNLSIAEYRSELGEVIFATVRMDHPDYCPKDRPVLKKRIRPLRCESVVGVLGKASLKHVEGARPLYNLDKLAARPTDPVLFVEGEVTAEAGEAIFPDHVVTTWPGGAQSDRLADLTPIVGRKVVFWPDNDTDGIGAAGRLAMEALRLGAVDCRIVEIPPWFPKKWDLANVGEDGETTPELLRTLLQDAPAIELTKAENGDAKKHKQAHRQDGGAKSEDLARSESLLRFLIDRKILDLGSRRDWVRVGIALKATHGEPAFTLWNQLSSEADGYDEDQIRKDWESFRDRPETADRLTMATFAKQAYDAGWSQQGRPSGAETNSDGGDVGGRNRDVGANASSVRFGKNVDAAAAAIELADEAGDEFWINQEDKPHVSFKVLLPDGREVVRNAPVASSVYRSVLTSRFHQAAVTKVLSADKATIALSLLEYRAIETGVRHHAALRVGEHQGTIYVDLGTPDGRAVRIDGSDWEVIDNPPVRFVRGSRGELPVPERGGTLADFQRHYNLSHDDLLRLLGFLIGVFNVGGSYAILIVDGEQGSGKSTLNDKNVSLVDPPRQAKSARMSFNAKEQDLHLGALGVHLPYFDNVSSFSGEASDALCRMSTGGGSGARKLYSDDQYNQLVVIRPVIITSIGAPSSRPDLLSRSVRITALPIGDQRRTEKSVMRAFEIDRPKMIGFIFSCVSAALRNREAVEQAVERGDFQLPRMADFAEFVEGAAEMLGLPPGGFSALIEEGQSAMQTDAVLGHPVGAALVKYFSHPNAQPIDAPAREVIAILTSFLPGEVNWPKANMVRKALSRLSVGLRSLGIEWEAIAAGGHQNVATLKIWATAKFKAPEPKREIGRVNDDPF